MTVSPTKLSDRDVRIAHTLMAALECFKELRHTMPMQYVLTFLLVATNEGRAVGAYAEAAGVSASVMSRHVLDIGPKRRGSRGDTDGFDLVHSRQNPENLREHNVYLTDTGRAVFRRVVRMLELQ